jgi:sec-independent protein translocase protein TatA
MFEGLFQPMHLLVIFFIALLVFGPKKLPELGKGIGEGIRALKDGMKDSSSDAPKSADTEVQSNRSKSSPRRPTFPQLGTIPISSRKVNQHDG